MDVHELDTLVGSLRRHGSDTTAVEVKRAEGGLSSSILSTLSAFGNLPGGGTILFGLDEASSFARVPLADPAGLCAGLASQARTGIEPPLQVDIEVVEFEGGPVVVAEVHEMPSSHKPCTVRRTGRAYLRSFDGDYPLSPLETQGLLANRSHAAFDLAAVSGAGRIDMDDEVIADFIATARETNRALARLTDDAELLHRSGATTESGDWTIAGCLTFGRYPQQWFPNLTVQAAVTADDVRGVMRVADTARFDGPLPAMLSDATEWISQRLRRGIKQNRTSGNVVDAAEYPLLAVREIVANALVHRDLAPWALSRAIEVRLSPDELTVTNPGGLFGITAQQLGRRGLTSARNGALVRLNQYTHSRGSRVIEALASGIPTVFSELDSAGLPAPQFFDQGIAFTVKLEARQIERPVLAPTPSIERLTPAEYRVLQLLDAPMTAAQISGELGIASSTVRNHLVALTRSGLVIRHGGRGQQSTTYQRESAGLRRD